MATRVIEHMYDDNTTAQAVVRDLESAGVPRDAISVLARHEGNAGTVATDAAAPGPLGSTTPSDRPAGSTDPEGNATGTGATLGTAIGGGLGLAAGLGALAIPGIGPLVAAGWLVATLTGAGIGAAGGGIIGALTGAGVSEDRANVYAEGIRRGGTLVLARVDETEAARVEGIMREHNPTDVERRGAEYRSTGWTAYEPAAPVTPTLDPATQPGELRREPAFQTGEVRRETTVEPVEVRRETIVEPGQVRRDPAGVTVVDVTPGDSTTPRRVR